MAPSRLPANPLASVRLRFGGWPALGAVAFGGLIGSAARAAIGLLLAADSGSLPIDILTVNLSGSLLLGIYVARQERAAGGDHRSLQFWAIGMIGSFTTFSTFGLDVISMLEADQVLLATGYTSLSLLGGLTLARLGLWVGRGRQ